MKNFILVNADILQESLPNKGFGLGKIKLTEAIDDFCGFTLIESLDDECIEDAMPLHGIDVIYSILILHLMGNYGIYSCDKIDHERITESRARGGAFSSLHEIQSNFIKIVTNPLWGTTTVCLLQED